MEVEQEWEQVGKGKKLKALREVGVQDDNQAKTEDKSKDRNNGRKTDMKIWRVGTWNVRSLTGKEKELTEEFEKVNIDILGVTETKKKGKGEEVLEGGHILIYSGVDVKERAREGVGCIVKRENQKYIQGWTSVTGRILRVDMKIDEQTTTTIVVAYGPSEDETTSRKEEFWEQMTEVAEETRGRMIILGDLNSRVGRKDEETGEAVGIHGENIRNDNGKRLIEFCMLNNLVITNTFYGHKDIHRFTREAKSRDEKSIIDYVIINKEYRREVRDTRVRRGAEIYSDHFLVLSKIEIGAENQCVEKKNTKEKNQRKEVIKTYRLREEGTAEKYREGIEIEMIKIKEQRWEGTSTETLWKKIRSSLIQTAKKVCGTKIINERRKQTRWWNEEIKREVKLKKQSWQRYLSAGTDADYRRYKEQRGKVKEMVKRAKQQSWEEFGERMETDRLGNQKLFYKVLKNLRKGKRYRNRFIKSEDGKVLDEEDDIMERWKRYFEDMLNKKQTDHVVIEEINEGEEQLGEEIRELDEIKVEEVKDSIRLLKRGKTAGHDGITAEMLKNMGRNGVDMLTKLFNRIWQEEKIPEDWELGILMPIHKKGDQRECSNYRGITILSTVLKVYERIIERRLKVNIEKQLEEPQCGFRKGRGVQDHIFTLKQLIEKSGETGMCVAFLDLEKAFDSIPRDIVWNCLKRRGVGGRLLGSIVSLYRKTRNYVRTGNLQSEEFLTRDGLRQGGVLSPTLFNLVMDDVIKSTKGKMKTLKAGYRKMEVTAISTCVFADDVAIFARSEQDLQFNIRLWKRSLEDRALKVNIEKTKVMSIGRERKKLTLTLDGKVLEQVDSFRYLGVMIHSSGKNEVEITDRVESTIKLYHSLNTAFIGKKEISVKTKMSVYKTVYRPVLSYGSESWTLTRPLKSKIQAVEMKYLRKVKGITRRDRVRNEQVREELNIEPIISTIEKQQMKWLGHLHRMTDERQVKTVWQTRTAQRRTRGRPRKTWNDVVAENLMKRGITWMEAGRLARDKKKWAEFIHK